VNILGARAASAIANQPLMLDSAAIYRAIAALQSLDSAQASAGSALYSPYGEHDRGYDVDDGIATIPIRGFLVQRLGSLRPWGEFVTGYDGIRRSLMNAIEDSAVRGIAFDINSPGGTTAGAFDLADTVRAARGAGKPMWSYREK
jgi:ClpP class serine protease